MEVAQHLSFGVHFRAQGFGTEDDLTAVSRIAFEIEVTI